MSAQENAEHVEKKGWPPKLATRAASPNVSTRFCVCVQDRSPGSTKPELAWA